MSFTVATAANGVLLVKLAISVNNLLALGAANIAADVNQRGLARDKLEGVGVAGFIHDDRQFPGYCRPFDRNC
jgi:hypothetical protein